MLESKDIKSVALTIVNWLEASVSPGVSQLVENSNFIETCSKSL